jgi:hypothetical protein
MRGLTLCRPLLLLRQGNWKWPAGAAGHCALGRWPHPKLQTYHWLIHAGKRRAVATFSRQ